MATRDNLIAAYNSNPTLQGQYTQDQYLNLFDFGQSTPQPAPNPPPTRTPPADGIQNIIGQNLNQGGGGGGGIQTLDPYSRPQGKPLDPNSFLGGIVQAGKNFGSSVVDKFSGIPGVEQGKGLIQNIMDNTLVGRLAAMRNPLNPKASNYNPSLQGQIDMLEDMTGTRVYGTSDNLKFEDGAMMIGRDPNSGLAKYGPGSVLSGQNVVSGFGTNDYIGQLDKYIEKMMSYATLSKFQQAKLDRAIAEKKAAEEKAMLEELAREEERARVAGVQRSLNTGTYVDRDSSGMSASDRAVGGGKGVAGLGSSAEARGSKSAQGYSQHAKGGRVKKRRSYFNDGGRVYLYNRLK